MQANLKGNRIDMKKFKIASWFNFSLTLGRRLGLYKGPKHFSVLQRTTTKYLFNNHRYIVWLQLLVTNDTMKNSLHSINELGMCDRCKKNAPVFVHGDCIEHNPSPLEQALDNDPWQVNQLLGTFCLLCVAFDFLAAASLTRT